jgi:hypothetical protein
MALPTYLVEIQFGSTDYVDVSEYVQNVTIGRGISRALENFSAGTMSVTFVNNKRIFDPLNTSSILYNFAEGYSMVQPGGNIRISANTGSRLFQGLIQNWEFSFDEAGKDGKATVSALDQIFTISNATFDAGTEPIVADTGSRIARVLNKNNFDYSQIDYGKAVVGADVHDAGDNVLAYLQNVARSEPGDLFVNTSGYMVFKDRTFDNYYWTPSIRNNLIAYPGTATANMPTWDGLDSAGPYGVDGWTLGGRSSAVTSLYGGTPNWATVNEYFSRYEMWYWDINPSKYNPNNLTSYPYYFSALLKGSALLSAQGGVYGVVQLLDKYGSILQQTNFPATTAVNAGTRKEFTFTDTYSGTSLPAGVSVRFYAGGTGGANFFYGEGFHFERGTSVPNYFDGNYNPYTSTAGTVYKNGWSGLAYKSYSGLVTSVRSDTGAPTIYTFADTNSQGASYGNGTGIPFTDLNVVYSGDQMYNSIQVVGVNATATASDTALIARYGLRSYAQTDNLTTSKNYPDTIAANYLSAFKYPEYRAESISISMESLSVNDQGRVLSVELRDVVRVCFRPSGTGAVVDKYYEVLGIDNNIDTERHKISFILSSLENIASF